MSFDPDLVLFPEYVGAGLVALRAPRVACAPSIRRAMVELGLRRPAAVLRHWLVGRNPLPRALLMGTAGAAREVYVSVFSGLAREHGVHIASGSALLSDQPGEHGRVCNTMMLFDPDGQIVGETRKVNLIPVEGEDGFHLDPADRSEIDVWRTDLGVIGPVICLDAWDRELVGRLVDRGAQVLLTASANPTTWNADELAERREGLYSRVAEFAVPGVEAFAVGALADLRFEGRSWILRPDPAEPDGVRVLARARSATEPDVIAATLPLRDP